MKFILSLILLAVTQSSFAEQVLFVFKKNLNPKNVLNYAAYPASDCTLKPNKDNNYIASFWIMGEERGQREGLTNREKKVFTPNVTYVDQAKSELDFTVEAVELLKKHIPDPSINVKAQKENGQCKTKAYMEFDGNEIELKEIYMQGRISWDLSWKTEYMTITGLYPDGRTFNKKISP